MTIYKKNVGMFLLATVMVLSLFFGFANINGFKNANAAATQKEDGSYTIVVFDNTVDKAVPTVADTKYTENKLHTTDVTGFTYEMGDFSNSFSNSGLKFNTNNDPSKSFVKVSIPQNYKLKAEFKLYFSGKGTNFNATYGTTTKSIYTSTGSGAQPVKYEQTTEIFSSITFYPSASTSIHYLCLTIIPTGESGGSSSENSSSSNSSASASTSPSTTSSSSATSSATSSSSKNSSTTSSSSKNSSSTTSSSSGGGQVTPTPTPSTEIDVSWNMSSNANGTTTWFGTTLKSTEIVNKATKAPATDVTLSPENAEATITAIAGKTYADCSATKLLRMIKADKSQTDFIKLDVPAGFSGKVTVAASPYDNTNSRYINLRLSPTTGGKDGQLVECNSTSTVDNQYNYEFDLPTNNATDETTTYYLSNASSSGTVFISSVSVKGTAPTPDGKFAVKFDPRNGDAVEVYKLAEGETATVPATPSRVGYDFVRWEDDNGNSYTSGQKFEVTASVTIFGVWKAKTYNVTYYLDGGNVTELKDKADYETTVTLPSPTKDGYIFIGWTVTDSNGNAIEVTDSSFKMPNADVTARANYVEKGEYQYYITIQDMNKKAVCEVGVLSTGMIDEEKALKAIEANKPNSNYRYGGLYKDTSKSTHGNKFDLDEETIAEGTVLYVLWIDPTVDTQSFNAYIDYIVDKTPAPSTKQKPLWGSEGFKANLNYIDGVFFNGLVNLIYQTKDTVKREKYTNFFLDYISYFVNADGTFRYSQRKELDYICETKVLFDAYELSGDDRYMKAVKTNFDYLMKMGKVDGTTNFEHKSNYANQVWLDGMYMYAPFYARYLASVGEAESGHTFNELRKQYEFIFNNMKAENGLYYHAYSPNTSLQWVGANGCSHNFWSRSVGWLAMSLTDVIEYFPEGADKQFLIEMLNKLMDSLIKFKDPDTNMYYQVLNHDSYIKIGQNEVYKEDTLGKVYTNYLETSGSSMFAYTLMKGARLGYLKSDTINYREEGEKTFEGIYNHSFELKNNVGNIYDICKMAGLDASGARNGSINYYINGEAVTSNDGKGLGPFILAYIEYTNENPVTPHTPVKKTATFVNGSNKTTVNFYTGKTITAQTIPSGYHWATIQNGEAFDFTTPLYENVTFYAVKDNEVKVPVKEYKKNQIFDGTEVIDGADNIYGYTFVGWTNDNGINVYKQGETVPADGAYTALFAKATFKGGAIKKDNGTAVKFAFEFNLYAITDNAILENLVDSGKMSGTFTVITTKENKASIKNCMVDNGKVLMDLIVINNIDATKNSNDQAKCELRLDLSIEIKVDGTSVKANGYHTIKDIAKQALEAGQIDAGQAQKYGYTA